MPPATWLARTFSGNIDSDNTNGASYWPNAVFITGLVASMGVNALMTGMIAFRIILKATGVIPTSVERTLGSTEGNKFRHIMFIVIESGMALFAIQLVRVVLAFISVPAEQAPFLQDAEDFVVVINQMLNVIIIMKSSFSTTSFVLLITFTLTRESHQR